MHPLILGAGLCALAAAQATAAPAITPAITPAACPPPQAPALERLYSADCADCWGQAAPGSAPAATGRWLFDWIVPGAADAPLAAGALAEAAERLQRLPADSASTAPGALPREVASPPRNKLNLRGLLMPPLRVVSGPAWNGYFGLQMTLQQARAGSNRAGLPAGSTAWLALVELLPAGSEGSPVPRALVRSVAGPLPLTEPAPGDSASHLRALRWPDGARPDRLQARAWIEAPTGQVLLMAADRCP